MALPLIAIAAALGAGALHEHNKNKYKRLELDRRQPEKPSGYEQHNRLSDVIKSPSDMYCSDIKVKPLPGSIVCCEVFNLLEHTGIWLDEDTIIELSNNGLVKAVSASRFLSARSGKNIFVACDQYHQPIVQEGCEQRALNSVFTYRGYDVIENNCHRFTHYCLSNDDREVSRFSRLNQLLIQLVNQNIYWDKVKL